MVKVAKPQQDMRFDVPTVGIKTLETMAAAGSEVFAIEADRTILLDQQGFLTKRNGWELPWSPFAETVAQAAA